MPKLERRFDRTARNIVVGIVALGWVWAFWTLGSFMYRVPHRSRQRQARPVHAHHGAADRGGHRPRAGAWRGLAALVPQTEMRRSPQATHRSLPPWLQAASDGLFGSVIEPMVDLIERLRWVALLALSIILTYRFADNIWGSFAYPFYMGAELRRARPYGDGSGLRVQDDRRRRHHRRHRRRRPDAEIHRAACPLW